MIGGPPCAPLADPLVPYAAFFGALGPLGARAHARVFRSRPRRAQPDAENELGAAEARNEALLLLLGAIVQDQRRGLTVGNPVRRDRRPRRQQLLDDDKARESPFLAAAVAPGQRQPQEARFAEPARKGDRKRTRLNSSH